MHAEAIGRAQIEAYRTALRHSEKSSATIKKYVRDVEQLALWLEKQGHTLSNLTKEHTFAYRTTLRQAKGSRSVNISLAAINGFFRHENRHDLTVSTLKIQQKMFWEEARLLTREEYERLLDAAASKADDRLLYVMKTLCSTGIRVSELQYITVEAVEAGSAQVDCKGKIRTILLPDKLQQQLMAYGKRRSIQTGPLFITKSGKLLNRSNIWRDMKKLCEEANVERAKIFPHNLRHLFARVFYEQNKDIVRLADMLGHSNIQTTRIYTLTSISTEVARMDQMDLVGREIGRKTKK